MVAVIEFQHVTKIYHRIFSEEKLAALSDVSFEMAPGQVCAFLGPNGAGKTTSINMLMGFFFPTAGQIRVFGRPPGDIAAIPPGQALLIRGTTHQRLRLAPHHTTQPWRTLTEAAPPLQLHPAAGDDAASYASPTPDKDAGDSATAHRSRP